jgi:hypothetical protein
VTFASTSYREERSRMTASAAAPAEFQAKTEFKAKVNLKAKA